jgi:vitamin B12 transporter
MSVQHMSVQRAALIAVFQFAVAAAGAATPEPAAILPVIVTATRVPQPLGEALEPVFVIDRDTIERSAAVDVGDLLRFHAGLDLGRTGGPGQPASLFIRGTNSDHAIVMVDGVRINPGTIGGAPFDNLAPELFDHVEVVKGPRSALYGTDAIGGVINFITQRGGPDGLDALVGYGRYATRQEALSGHYASGELTAGFAASALDTAGFPTFDTDWRDRGYRNRSATAHVSTELDGVQLGAHYWRAAGSSEYSNPLYDANFNVTGYMPADESFLNSSTAFDAGGDLSAAWHTKATLSHITDDLRQRQAPDFDYTSRTSLDWQNDLKLGPQALTFGVMQSHERTTASLFGTGYDVSTHAATYYVEDQLDVGRNRLVLALAHNQNSIYGHHNTWNAEYGIRVADATRLTIGAGTAFRAPSSTDRFGYGGNPNLRPERSRNLELGLKSRIAERHTVSLAAFDNRIDDLVNFVNDFSNPFGGENQNVDRARIRGVEASYEYLGRDWQARLEAIHQDPLNLGDGSWLLRRARNSYTLSAVRHFGPNEIGFDLLDSGDRVDFGFPAPVHLGGYLLANLNARYALSRSWSVQARLENALDRRYELASGYNTSRRAAFLATRYAIR